MAIFKSVVFLAAVVWLTKTVFFDRPAQAALPVNPPLVKSFTYKNPDNYEYHVSSWIADGIKCTAITSKENSLGTPSLSCVEINR